MGFRTAIFCLFLLFALNNVFANSLTYCNWSLQRYMIKANFSDIDLTALNQYVLQDAIPIQLSKIKACYAIQSQTEFTDFISKVIFLKQHHLIIPKNINLSIRHNADCSFWANIVNSNLSNNDPNDLIGIETNFFMAQVSIPGCFNSTELTSGKKEYDDAYNELSNLATVAGYWYPALIVLHLDVENSTFLEEIKNESNGSGMGYLSSGYNGDELLGFSNYTPYARNDETRVTLITNGDYIIGSPKVSEDELVSLFYISALNKIIADELTNTDDNLTNILTNDEDRAIQIFEKANENRTEAAFSEGITELNQLRNDIAARSIQLSEETSTYDKLNSLASSEQERIKPRLPAKQTVATFFEPIISSQISLLEDQKQQFIQKKADAAELKKIISDDIAELYTAKNTLLATDSLETSRDGIWVAIGLGILAAAISIVVAIWQVRRSEKPPVELINAVREQTDRIVNRLSKSK